MANKWIVRVTNNSGSTVELKDLGIKIADGITKTLSEFFKFDILSTSADLKAAISSGLLQVNDGLVDLGIDDGIELVFLENRYNTEEIYAKKTDLTEFDHSASLNRNIPFQHPISAITDLQDTLDLKAGIDYVDFGLLTHIDDFHALSAIHTADVVALSGEIESVYLDLLDHIDDVSNPHEVTQTQVGLGNVDNTSDLNKPISTATQLALDLKANITYVNGLSATYSTISYSDGHDSFLSGAISNNTIDVVSLSGAIDDLSSGDILEFWSESFNGPNVTVWEALSGNSIIIQGANGNNFIDSPWSTIGGGLNNSLSGEGYSTIGGGLNNSISVSGSTIGGGLNNTTSHKYTTIAGGIGNTASGRYSTIGGGQYNTASEYNSTVCGGEYNTATNFSTVVAGGEYNNAIGWSSAIGGGQYNNVTGDYSAIAGGDTNINNGFCCFIGGGYSNTLNGSWSTIAGGNQHSLSGTYSFIGGGNSNIITNNEHSVIGGGLQNTINSDYSFIGSGINNTTNSEHSFIGSGWGNTVSGIYSFIGGGNNNTVSAANTTIAGGYHNIIASGSTSSAIAGGSWNKINSTSTYSFIGGGGGANDGNGNEITGNYSSIVGGFDNNIIESDYSFIGGGEGNQTNTDYSSIIGGRYATTNTYGQQAYASGRFATTGDAQTSKLVLRGATTNNTPKVLTTDSSGGGITNQLIVADGQAISFLGTVTAKQDSSTNVASWKIEGVIVREGATTTLVDHTITVISNIPGWVLGLSADDTNEALAITFTGALATNIRVVAAIDTSEVIY